MKTLTFRPAIGAEYRTGERSPRSVTYAFARYIHIQDGGPEPTPESWTIPLARGNPFPPCMGRGAVWRLVGLA